MAGGADAAGDAVQDAAQALHDEIVPAPDSVLFALGALCLGCIGVRIYLCVRQAVVVPAGWGG